MRFTPKIITLVNNPDNFHCLQVCILMALSHYGIISSLDEISELTGFVPDRQSWILLAVNVLNVGLNARLVSLFDYQRLVVEGIHYVREFKRDYFFEEQRRGDYGNMNFIQSEAEKMIKTNSYSRGLLSSDELAKFLSEYHHLAIAKTQSGWLGGDHAFFAGNSHYVLCTRECKNGNWEIYDPGIPTIKRHVSKSIKGIDEVFGEIILIQPKS